jgi:PEGA domain
MRCPNCDGEVPNTNFYCSHCRAEMPNSVAGLADAPSVAAKSKTNKAKSASVQSSVESGDVMANRPPLFRIAWQGMQYILAGIALFGAFVAYKRIDWQSSAKRVNEVASVTRPVQAAGVATSRAGSASLREKMAGSQKQVSSDMRGRPMATQATATAGLLIVKSPVAARIYVDGKFAGNTPHSFTVPAGEHQLLLLAEGYEEWSRSVLMRGNQQMGIMAALQKQAGQ